VGLLSWLRRKYPAPPLTPLPSTSYGADTLEGDVNRATTLMFEYVDRDGVASLRKVTDWVDTRFYVKGRCADRRAVRTFRKDQIEFWVSGQEALRHGVLDFGRSRF